MLAYYIDDQANATDETLREEVIRYTERISDGGQIDCHLFAPPQWREMGNTIFNPVPDLFLIDYDLNLQQQDGSLAEYRGSTLAAEIRVRHPDRPIILVTRQSILDELDHRKKLQVIEQLRVFDEMLLKSDLEEGIAVTRNHLISLAEGYRLLSNTPEKNWGALTVALQCDDYNADRLREASPPLKHGEWIPSDLSSWIRHTVLEYPGILYDSLYASVHLGITEESFLSHDIAVLFDAARYKGVFSDNDRYQRWWRSELFRIADEIAQDSNLERRSDTSLNAALSSMLNYPVEQPNCVWDCEPVADWVCYVLRQPVKLEHTLRYYPDNRPDVMDDARISFRALWDPRKYEKSLLDSKGSEMLKSIEDAPDPCVRNERK